tara:strand:- start:661 stop:3882 length:3222 start_codon:yes stop_codon:yes gene_type:complete
MADTVPAMLEPGEFVIRRDAARRIGQPALNALNNFDRVGGAHGAIDELIALGGLGMQEGGFAPSPYGSFHELVQARGSAEEGSEEYQLLQDQINALYQQGGGTYEGATEAFGTPAQPNVPAQSDPTQNLTQQPTSLSSLTQQFAPQQQMPQTSDVGGAYDPSTWTERSPLGKSLMSTFSGDQSYEPSLGDQLTQRAGLYGRGGYQEGGAVGTDSSKFVGPLSVEGEDWKRKMEKIAEMSEGRPELGLRRDYVDWETATPEKREAFERTAAKHERKKRVMDEADLARSMRSDPDFADVEVPNISSLLRLQEGYTKGRTAVDDTESAFSSSLGRARELEDLNFERHLDVVGEQAARAKRKELTTPKDIKWGKGSPYPVGAQRQDLPLLEAQMQLGIRDVDPSVNPMRRERGAGLVGSSTEDAGWTRKALPTLGPVLSDAEYLALTTPGVSQEEFEDIEGLHKTQFEKEAEERAAQEKYVEAYQAGEIEDVIGGAQQALGTDWQDPMAFTEEPKVTEETGNSLEDIVKGMHWSEFQNLDAEGERNLRNKIRLESGYSQEEIDMMNMYKKSKGFQQGGMVGETRREYTPGTSLGVVDEDRTLMSQLKNMQGDISLLQLQKDMHYPDPKMFKEYRSLKESMGDIMTQEEMMGVLNKAAKKTQGMFKPEGYQEGGEVASDATRTSQMEDIFLSQKRPLRMTPLWEQIIRGITGTQEPMTPDEKTDRYFRDRGPVLMDEEQPIFVDPKDVKDLYSMQRRDDRYDKYNTRDYFMNRGARAYDIDELLKMRNKGESVQDALMGYQDGGNVYSYAGAGTSTVPTLEDIWASTGIKPNQANIDRFEEYDPSREKTVIDDYWGNLESMRKSGGAKVGEARKQAQAVGKGFSGMGQRGAGVQDTLSSMMEAQKAGGEQEYRGLFESIRGMREDYLTEQTANLYDIDAAEGTIPNKTNVNETAGGEQYLSQDAWYQLGFPDEASWQQWVDAGSNSDTMGQYGQSPQAMASNMAATTSLSDVRLKKDINYIFTMKNGVPIYTFNYKWSDDVNIGTMAQDIEDMIPEAVSTNSAGYKMVNYSKVFNYGN